MAAAGPRLLLSPRTPGEPGPERAEVSGMGAYVRVGRVAEFRKGRGRIVELDGRKIAVFRTDSGFAAVSDACAHMGASLAGGRIVEGAVECPWHHWRYDLRSGQSGARPWARVTVYDVKVAGGDVLVRRPDPPGPERPRDEGAEDEGRAEEPGPFRWER